MSNKRNCRKDDRWCIIKQEQWGTKGAVTAKRIAEEIDKIPHKVYVEPFMGKGNVFRAKSPSEEEIVNDISCKQLTKAREKLCIKKDNCQRFKATKRTCGKDYKEILRKHDSRDTLHYLDPPYLQSDNKVDNNLTFKNKYVPLDEIIDSTKHLKGKVLISYSDKPEFREQLCKKPFKCKKIPKQLFDHEYNEILAIKK